MCWRSGVARSARRPPGHSLQWRPRNLLVVGRAHACESPMAEPPRMSPPAAGVTERDVLLATKLHVPQPRAGFLPRPRLLERLAEGMSRALVLVCTPAGFGKTSLLGDWARRAKQPTAWLSLDEGDNDPARFWRYVAAALDPVCEGVGGRVAALLRGPQPPLEAVVTVVVNALAAQSDQTALVLDDYHLVEAAPVHHSLGLLLDRLPAQLRLVVASRADPPLPLARLRARGQLVELRAADLRFTPEETTVLLRGVIGLELSAASLAALGARTEGWVAGLQLAALSLHGHADVTAFVASFSGSHRFVLDYLTEEVLDRQPEPLREFLLETSVLDRVCGPLADAVTGRSDGQQLLEQVERANLFLVPLDEVRGWWRYHQLFADLLRARLQQADPDRVAGLHRAAAAWCERHGLIDEAMRHAVAADDTVWAARLIEQHFEALLRRSEDATLRRWLEALLAEVVRSRPRLSLAQAFRAVTGGRLEAVESLLADAERAFAAVADEPYEPSVGRAASLVANVPAAIALDRAAVAHFRGDAEQTIALARRAPAELDEGEWMLESVTRWYLAVAKWLRGNPAEAERAFASMIASIARWRAAGLRVLAAWGYHYLGQVRRAQGRLGAALGTYPGGAGGRLGAGRAGPAGCGRWVCGHGRGCLPARRARRRPGGRHPRRRVVQAARLDPAAGGGPGHPGSDSAGAGRPGPCPGGDPGGRAGRGEPCHRRPAQPSTGGVGLAGPRPWPGRRRRPLGPGERPRRRGRAELPARARVPGPGAWAAGAVACPGRDPGTVRRHHRAPGVAGAGVCGPRRRARRAGHPRRGARIRRARGLPAPPSSAPRSTPERHQPQADPTPHPTFGRCPGQRPSVASWR